LAFLLVGNARGHQDSDCQRTSIFPVIRKRGSAPAAAWFRPPNIGGSHGIWYARNEVVKGEQMPKTRVT
jgi:hypothetical protein